MQQVQVMLPCVLQPALGSHQVLRPAQAPFVLSC